MILPVNSVAMEVIGPIHRNQMSLLHILEAFTDLPDYFFNVQVF